LRWLYGNGGATSLTQSRGAKICRPINFLIAFMHDVRYLFFVNTPHLGIAPPAWLPPSALSFKPRAKPDPGARGRRFARGWLRQLGDVGVRLVAGIRELARSQAEAGGQADIVPTDINMGWRLVRRATRWMAALRFRLVAEAAAGRPKIDPPTKLDPLAQVLAAAEADTKATRRRPRAAGQPKPARARVETHEVRYDACIDGIPTAAVLAQICADLGAASTVLIELDARRLIEAIATEARTLLGESTVALLPAPRVIGRWYAMPPPQATMSGVVPPAATPGTG
jgi:hypothetical protein